MIPAHGMGRRGDWIGMVMTRWVGVEFCFIANLNLM